MIRLNRKKNMKFIYKVWCLMAPFHHTLFLILGITAMFEIIRMGGPYLFGKILDLLIQSKGLLTTETIIYIVGTLVGVRLLSLIIDYITDLVIVRLIWDSEKYISTTSFNKMLGLSLDYHEKENTGAKINIVNRGTDKLIDLIGAFTWEFQPIVLQILVSATLIILTSWKVGLIFSISIIPFIFITFKLYQSTNKLRVKRFDAYETSSGEIGDTISNITVVKAFAQEEREKNSFSGLWGIIRDISSKEFRIEMIIGFGRNLLVEFFYVTLLIISIIEVKNNALTVGSLVFLINIIERAYSNTYRLGRIYARAVEASEPVDRITELMRRVPTVQNDPSAIKPQEIDGQLSFRHVTFAYNKKRVLKNVSFTIPAGSFTAIVGKSGCGKSTIAKLISRYYDPIRGGIFIDKKYNLKSLDLDEYRKNTAVVFQDSPVPNRRIWEIIAYSAGKTTFNSVSDRVVRAAKLAHAHEFITELEDGYQTQVGERGVKLSGGQKQRLAIARALFAQPKILIMDEPTSHLDSLSEALIQQALHEISLERSLTKIVIAHRLSTVQNADQILVMEKGKLVEKGTHTQLMAKRGIYAQIVHQSELKQ